MKKPLKQWLKGFLGKKISKDLACERLARCCLGNMVRQAHHDKIRWAQWDSRQESIN